MDLQARLDGYEVTAVPLRAVRLRLVWAEAAGEDPEPAEAPGTGPALAILDDYRITRVPGRAAS